MSRTTGERCSLPKGGSYLFLYKESVSSFRWRLSLSLERGLSLSLERGSLDRKVEVISFFRKRLSLVFGGGFLDRKVEVVSIFRWRLSLSLERGEKTSYRLFSERANVNLSLKIHKNI